MPASPTEQNRVISSRRAAPGQPRRPRSRPDRAHPASPAAASIGGSYAPACAGESVAISAGPPEQVEPELGPAALLEADQR